MVDPPIPFVDAHHHLWDLERHHYAWLKEPGWDEETAVLGDYSAIRRTYLAEDMIRDAMGTGLAKTVHVQADWSGADDGDETNWLEACGDATGVPSAIVAHADPSDPQLEVVLARHLASGRLRGIRCSPSETRLVDDTFRRGVERIGRVGLSFDLRATPGNAAEAAALAGRLGDVTFIVGHTGEPQGRSEADRAIWRVAIRRLAGVPNVAIKISGLGMRDHRWTTDSITPWVLEAIDVFGIDRCLFGTNWPVDSLYSTYGQLVAAYRSIVGSFSAAEQRALLGGNAERLYRI
jgi:predicted TIM-barrel fold metal-dependent hydrolase